MSIETVSLRERLQDELARFEAIDAAVFTTFTLVPDFFEQNVLPALFGVEGSGRTRRRVQVNGRLATAPVAVFYDMSTQPRGGGEFRYQPVPVRLNKGGIFHPKVTVVAGRLKEEGEMAVLVCVTSANLTLRAWAHNEEVAGTFWLRNESQRDEVGAFLRFLGKCATAAAGGKEAVDRLTEVDALTRLTEVVSSLDGLDRNAAGDPEFHCFGLRRQNEELPATVITPGRRYWSSLTAFSPYWSNRDDTLALARQFRARACHLVPAPRATGDQVRLGIDDPCVDEQCVDAESRRFRHAKIYVAEGSFGNKRRARITVGSANFTTAALGVGDTRPINVEAVVCYDVGPRQLPRLIPPLVDMTPEGTELCDDGIAEESNDPIPFTIYVAFDWTAREYRVSLADPGKALDFLVVLPGAGEHSVLSGDSVIPSDAGPSASKEFSVHYRPTEDAPNREVAYGLITEVGLEESDHKYTPALKLQDFFASWLRKNSADIYDTPTAVEDDDEESAGALEGGQDVPTDQLDATNLFEIYFAIAELERHYLAPAAEAKQWGVVREFLVTRPDSCDQLAKLLLKQTTNLGVRLALLLECGRLFRDYGEEHAGDLERRCGERIDKAIADAKSDVLADLRADTRVGETARATLTWMEKQLMEAWR